MRLMVLVLLFSAIWFKPIIDPAGLTWNYGLMQTWDTFRQWTLTRGTITRKPIMWRTAAQLRKHKEVRRSLYGTSATAEASRRSTEEYTSLDDSISVTPDTDDTTSYETTSQYEVMEDDGLLSESVQRKNKAMFHLEHRKGRKNK